MRVDFYIKLGILKKDILTNLLWVNTWKTMIKSRDMNFVLLGGIGLKVKSLCIVNITLWNLSSSNSYIPSAMTTLRSENFHKSAWFATFTNLSIYKILLPKQLNSLFVCFVCVRAPWWEVSRRQLSGKRLTI